MKSVAKSLLLAFVGTGLFFFFLMMAVLPTMALLARESGRISQKSVVVDPTLFMRTYGLPMAAIAFVALFGIAMYRFRRMEHQPLAGHR